MGNGTGQNANGTHTSTKRMGIDLFETLMHTANDAILCMDLSGNVIYCNLAAQKYYGYQENELTGQKFINLFPKEFSTEFAQIKENILLNEYVAPFESQRITKNKEPINVSVAYSIIKDKNNKIIGISSVERKITDYRKVESKAQALLETAPDAMIIVNASGQIVLANAQTEKLFGYTKEELLGQEVEMLLPGQFKEKHKHHRKKFFAHSNTRPMGMGMELFGHKKNGEQFPVAISLSPLTSEEGTLVSAAIRDITLQKSAVAALRWSQQQLDAFFMQALDGLFFMMLDEPIQWDDATDKDALIDYAFEHQHMTRVNDALLQQYRTTREQFVGLTPKVFFKHNIAKGKKVWRKFFDKGRLHIKTDERRFDGSQMWVEGDYICLYDDAGKIKGHFGIQRDVTDKKLAEEKYRILADNMLDMVALHAPDGTYKYISPSVSKLLGYQPEELIGQNPYQLFHPEDIQRIIEDSHKPAKAGEEILDIEYRIRKKDETYIWFSTHTKPITNEIGEVIMLQTVSRDVTEKVAVMQRLEEINAQKNKLFSVIGHDLRSPLSTCIGLLDLLQAEGKKVSPDEMNSYLLLIKQSTTSLQDLLDDLLVWANAQSDDITFKPRVLNLFKEVNKVVHHLSESAKAKKIIITAEIDKVLQAHTDEHMINTVIRNLVSNGIKFTRSGGKITIRASSTKDEVIVSVADNGIGIKEETVHTLFINTTNYSTYGTQGEKGTGLGLHLCKDFVERLGGKIWVESEYGKGSTFSFSIKNVS